MHNFLNWMMWIAIATNWICAFWWTSRAWNWRRKKSRATAQLPAILPLLEEINAGFQSITEADIERAERGFTPASDADIKLGVVHSLEARKLYAMGFRLKMQCQEAALASQGRASCEEEAELWREQAARFDQMEDCTRQWFWAQVRDDIGGKAWTSGTVGIRSGWMLVSVKPQIPSLPFLQRMFGGQDT